MNLLYLNTKTIRLLSFKKDIFRQIEVDLFAKTYETEIFNTEDPNIDIIASAVKESYNNIFHNKKKTNKFVLILSAPPFEIIRAELPTDISANTEKSFISQKVISTFPNETKLYTYSTENFNNKKTAVIYALDKRLTAQIKSAFDILDFKLEHIIPEPALYFHLFANTLSKTKTEHIWFMNTTVFNNQILAEGYFYDNLGAEKTPKISLTAKNEEELKQKIIEIREKKEAEFKFHRLILGGYLAHNTRQDILTKELGIWVNPLYKIVEEYHLENLKKFVNYDHTNEKFWDFLPQLASLINKDSPAVKIDKSLETSYRSGIIKTESKGMLNQFKPGGFVFNFLISLILAFSIMYGYSRIQGQTGGFNLSLPNNLLSRQQPTATPQPTAVPTNTPTPTPSINKEEINIKILNGSGVRGQAGKLQTYLEEKGYSQIITGNADNFDYTKTEIQYKSEQLMTVVRDDLKEVVDNPSLKLLEDDSNADIVIIIGSDLSLE
ncbi:MAG: hypothetical protein KatS3mg091_600 [Patescibacteria group bacterium]|nr:MAG: hypothetical protein KatS3mg091_600 [Patescibacteria group bacterium]